MVVTTVKVECWPPYKVDKVIIIGFVLEGVTPLTACKINIAIVTTNQYNKYTGLLLLSGKDSLQPRIVSEL